MSSNLRVAMKLERAYAASLTRRRTLAVMFLVASLVPAATGANSSVKGYVSHRISGCDYFLVSARNGYDVLEWYGDHDPDKGDVMVGGYEEFGFHDVYDETADEPTRVYTEDYQLSKADALEKLTDECQ
jgi:hypothetical protein